ncbi:hypothetical protein GUJ93_ZPchr0010g11087 [Zizania palustris]|uniref:Uncharacterized protein n=1 Tax=Zizania palustris TaxID=103762 RepID=A0A8J5WGH5_ZIZPA|nr:hypothetical protein GUJ93_ZPchr0010g11087 [Zizania palustris]
MSMRSWASLTKHASANGCGFGTLDERSLVRSQVCQVPIQSTNFDIVGFAVSSLKQASEAALDVDLAKHTSKGRLR